MSHADATGNARRMPPPPPVAPPAGPPPTNVKGASVNIEVNARYTADTFDRDGDGAISISGSEHTMRELTGSLVKRTSVERLVRAADAMGNNDGKATAEEIAHVQRQFDTGHAPHGIGRGDGHLSGRELDSYKQTLGPETKTDVIGPAPVPLPVRPPEFWAQPQPLPHPPEGVRPHPQPQPVPLPIALEELQRDLRSGADAKAAQHAGPPPGRRIPGSELG